MRKSNFLTVFLATIIILRTVLYFVPRTSRIYTDNFHHIYIGIILLIIYSFYRFSPLILAFSLALVVDQITQVPFYILRLISIEIPISLINYWSPYAVTSTVTAVIISVILIKKWEN